MQTTDEISVVEIPVKERKQMARREILERSIVDDQDFIIDRWAKTFTDVGEEDHLAHEAHLRAVQFMMLTMAAVAQGDFEVSEMSSSDKKVHSHRPSNALFVADYLSHASRVTIDFSGLTAEQKAHVSSLFSTENLDPRPSTHYTERDTSGILTEKKSKLAGAQAVLLNALDVIGRTTRLGDALAPIVKGPALTDFGIDIFMGGINQPNLSQGISERGRDGHVLIHRNATDDSVMIGLEQTKPISNQSMQDALSHAGGAAVEALQSTWNFISRKPSPPTEGSSPVRKTPSPELPTDEDNTFGLSGKHSMLGDSDDYTSAGSLYFSNLIYKLKLLEDKRALTPAKYNGMHVRLNSGNVDAFLGYFNALSTARQERNVSAIKALLKQLPQTAMQNLSSEESENNCVFLVKSIKQEDLNAFFKQLNDVYDEERLNGYSVLFETKLKDIKAWLSEPRQLPEGKRVLNAFGEGVIASPNPHVQRLAKTFNHAVMILKEQASEELMQRLAEPSEVIQQMRLLEQAYGRIELAEGNPPIYEHFKTQRDNFNELSENIRAANSSSSSEDTQFPFGYLMALEQQEKDIKSTVSTNESRAMIALMRSESDLLQSNQALRHELQARTQEIAMIEERERQQESHALENLRNVGEQLRIEKEKTVLEQRKTEELTRDNQGLRQQMTELGSTNEALKGQLESLRQELEAATNQRNAATTAVSELHEANEPLRRDLLRINEELSALANPVLANHPLPLDEDEVNWNWAFVWQCMSSSAALNTYGAILIAASLIIASAVTAGAIPVVLGAGIAVSGLALSAVCFFNARSNHSVSQDSLAADPTTPRQDV